MAYYAAKCLTCHTTADCPETPHAVSSLRTECTACHMPKRDVRQISHSALTDHRIPGRPGAPPVATPESGSDDLILFNKSERHAHLPLITELKAYGELQERVPQLRPGYLKLLERARAEIPDDPLVLAALGRKALIENRPEALDYLVASEKNGGPAASTYIDLSEALSRAGKQEEAIGALERGQAAYTFSAAIRKHLILRYIRLQRYTEARTAMEQYLEIFPEDSFMRNLVAQVQTQ